MHAGLLVAALGLLAVLVGAALGGLQVGEDQLEVDDLDVADRVDAVLDMGDVGVVEAADDVEDGVHAADVPEELVAEAFALGRAADKAGDVDELDLSLDLLRRFGDVADAVEPFVGDGDAADVWLDRAEGIVGRLRRRSLGQRVEKCGFANVRQADDAAAEAHSITP